MRLILVISLAFAFIMSCQTEEKTMREDVEELVKLEKQIVDLTIKANTKAVSDLDNKVDSLTNILQRRSNELQQKYKKQDKLKDFQEAYEKIKTEMFEK